MHFPRPLRLSGIACQSIFDKLSSPEANHDNPSKEAYDCFETKLSETVQTDAELSAWIQDTIRETLFPGLKGGPIFVDLGYRFFFNGDSKCLVLLPQTRLCCKAIQSTIENQNIYPAATAADVVDEMHMEGDEAPPPRNELTEEIADTVNGTQPTDLFHFEDDEESAPTEVSYNMGGISEAAALAIEGYMEESEDEEEMEIGDHSLSEDNYVNEVPSELSQLAEEAKAFVDNPEFSEYLDSLALVYSSNRNAGVNQVKSLKRSKAEGATYLFGTPFGNVYTGYPRIRLKALRRQGMGISGSECLPYDGIEYPLSGPTSCVVYPSGLKNTNVTLHDSIKPHAICGFAATTKLLLDQSELIPGEWSTCISKWRDMIAIAKLQIKNEEHFLDLASRETMPFSHCLRIEFRMVVDFGQGTGSGGRNAEEEGRVKESIKDNFNLPWPHGVLSSCEGEHTQRFHQYRLDTLQWLYQPIKVADSLFHNEGGKKLMWSLSKKKKNFLVGAAGVMENFIAIFVSPSNNQYALYSTPKEVRAFFESVNQDLEESDSQYGIPHGIEDNVVGRFERTQVQRKLISPRVFVSLSSRVKNFTERGMSGAQKKVISANRLNPYERNQRDTMKRHYFKKRNPINPTAIILSRQKFKGVFSEWTKPCSCQEYHQSLIENTDWEENEEGESSQTLPLFFWWTKDVSKKRIQEDILEYLRELYFTEYDTLIQRHQLFDQIFPSNDTFSSEELFSNAKENFDSLSDAVTDISGTSNKKGIFFSHPFHGLNRIRRKIGLKTDKRDSPFNKAGK